MKELADSFVNFPSDVWQLFIIHMPGTTGTLMRYRYWSKRLKYLGKNVKIDPGVYFQNSHCISIDDNCWIDRGVMILAGKDRSRRARRYIENPLFPAESGSVYIGKNVHIGPHAILSGIGGIYISDECGFSAGVKVYSFTNHFRSDHFPADRNCHFGPLVDHCRMFMIEGPVFLGKNVGVALNATILPGVSIGKDSFVSINSVVKTNFEENSLIEGNPTQSILNRFWDKKNR